MSQAWTCRLLMLTVSPVVTCTIAVLLEPSRWGGSPDPLTILGMALFGVMTVYLWPTYMPALILTPVLMRRLVRTRSYQELPLSGLLGISAVVGAVAGVMVLLPVIWVTARDSELLARNWAIAGAVAGSVTLCLVVCIYRREKAPPPVLKGK